MQPGEVGLAVFVELEVDVKVDEIDAPEHYLASQPQCIRIRNLDDDLGVVSSGDELACLLVVDLDSVCLGGAHTPGDVKPVDLRSQSVLGERTLHLANNIAIQPPGPDK